MLFSFTFQACFGTENATVSVCKNAELSDAEKKTVDSCCYYLEKEGATPSCMPINKKDVKKYIKEYKKFCPECKGISIDCSGKFLSLASALLMLVLLL